MNPEETNPMANTGAAGTTSGGMAGSPMDFTTSNDGAKLSMADSLASAEDNLTSAGMAAKTIGSDAIGLDQIGASDPTATMARPDEPLTPAAPVPGSLGSAMSGPAIGTTMPSAGATSPMGASSTGASPAGTMSTGAEASSTSSMGGASGFTTAPATSTSSTAMNAGMGASTAVPMGSGMTGSASQAPYNPFAIQEPAPVQPKVDMAAATKSKKKPNTVMIIMIGLIAVLAVAVVVLAVLWQQAVNNPKIKYVTQQPAGEQPVAEDVTLVCSRTMGAEEVGAEGMVGLTSVTETNRMNYVADTLSSVAMMQSYLFADAMAAQGMTPMFDQIAAGMPGTVNYMVNDMTVDLSIELSGDQLSGWVSSILNQEQTTGDVSVISLGEEEAKANLEGQGYTCSEE